jgi:hypothetical protein
VHPKQDQVVVSSPAGYIHFPPPTNSPCIRVHCPSAKNIHLVPQSVAVEGEIKDMEGIVGRHKLSKEAERNSIHESANWVILFNLLFRRSPEAFLSLNNLSGSLKRHLLALSDCFPPRSL